MPVYLVAVRPQQPVANRALIASAHAALGLELDAVYEERHYLLGGELEDGVPQQLAGTLPLHAAINAGLVRACHDVSEGGLAVAVAKISFGSNLGVDLDHATTLVDDDCLNDATVLFSETPSRFLVEVRPSAGDPFGVLPEGVQVALLGFVTAAPVLRVDGVDGREVLREPIAGLKATWLQPAQD